MPEHPSYGPIADNLVSLTRAWVEEVPDASQAIGMAIGQIGRDRKATVGVFGTLIYRVAAADMQALALAAKGVDVPEKLLEPTGDPTADHFLGLARQAAFTAIDHSPGSAEVAEVRNTLATSYANLEASSDSARDALLTLTLRLVMHEMLRGLDVSTVVPR